MTLHIAYIACEKAARAGWDVCVCVSGGGGGRRGYTLVEVLTEGFWHKGSSLQMECTALRREMPYHWDD